MCVIIDKPAGATLPEADLRAAAGRNDDGFGYFYIHPETGEFKVHRQLMTFKDGANDVVAAFERLKNYHVVFHLRMATEGGVTLDNVHPFQVLNKTEHKREMWMMHNGMFGFTPKKAGWSDTRVFVDQWLTPVLKKAPSLIFELAWQDMCESFIGTNRILFMNDKGQIARLGKWERRNGCIVSNNSYFTHQTYTARNQQGQFTGNRTTVPVSQEQAGQTTTTSPTGGTNTPTVLGPADLGNGERGLEDYWKRLEEEGKKSSQSSILGPDGNPMPASGANGTSGDTGSESVDKSRESVEAGKSPVADTSSSSAHTRTQVNTGTGSKPGVSQAYTEYLAQKGIQAGVDVNDPDNWCYECGRVHLPNIGCSECPKETKEFIPMYLVGKDMKSADKLTIDDVAEMDWQEIEHLIEDDPDETYRIMDDMILRIQELEDSINNGYASGKKGVA